MAYFVNQHQMSRMGQCTKYGVLSVRFTTPTYRIYADEIESHVLKIAGSAVTSVSPAFTRAPENPADIHVQNCPELLLFH